MECGLSPGQQRPPDQLFNAMDVVDGQEAAARGLGGGMPRAVPAVGGEFFKDQVAGAVAAFNSGDVPQPGRGIAAHGGPAKPTGLPYDGPANGQGGHGY